MATNNQVTQQTLKVMQEALANPVPWINTTSAADNTRVLNNYESVYSGNAEAISVKTGKVTKEMTSFKEVTIAVIANLEGGYYHPKMLTDGRVKDSKGFLSGIDPQTGAKKPGITPSGETMYGLDRVNGGKVISDCKPCQKFWGLIDKAEASNKWKYNYIPPNPLKTQLQELASEIMEPLFNDSLKRYVPEKEIQNLIKSDGRLYFNFVYAQWNGPGWFQGFAKEIRSAYNSGIKDTEKLAALFVRRRKNNTGVIGNRKNNDLIAKTGNTISNIVGLA